MPACSQHLSSTAQGFFGIFFGLEGEVFEVGGLVFFETLEVTLVVVGLAIVPAAPEDAQPFESEAADDGMVRFLALFLMEVVGAGPVAITHADGSPLDQGLAG